MSDSQQHPGRPPEEPRDLRRVSVLLPPRLVSALDSAARAQGGATNRSDVIRTACDRHLREIGHGSRPAGSTEPGHPDRRKVSSR